jgi:hypothetical protein
MPKFEYKFKTMSKIFKFNSSEMELKASFKIPASVAKAMHKAYLALPEPLLVNVDGNIKVLEGFAFKKEHILDMLNRTDCDVSELFIMFGADENGYVKIIGGGLKDSPGSTDHKALLADKLYDMCEPCPDKCPSNIDSYR